MYHKWQSYNVWFLRYGARQTEFFLILEHFLPFYPTNNPKNQNFEKIKAGDIIILQNCTKNHDHMLYCSWEMAHDRCNFYFSFQAIFGSFTSLTAWKIKILKKWKKCLEITIVYQKLWSDDVPFQKYAVHNGRMDGLTDKQKKWHIELGTHLKIRQSNSFKTLKKRSMTTIIFFSRQSLLLENLKHILVIDFCS